jgi:hypothetical protein
MMWAMGKEPPKTDNSDSPPVHVERTFEVKLSDWLAYGLGGFLIIGNAYQLPALFNNLTQVAPGSSGCVGTLSSAYGSTCDPNVLTLSAAVMLYMPFFLLVLGLLIILYKRRFLAQIVAGFLLVELGLLYSPFLLQTSGSYFGSTDYWAYLLQPSFQVPVVQLVLAAVGSRLLLAPSLFSPIEKPAIVASMKPLLKRWRKAILTTLGVVIVLALIIWGGVSELNSLSHTAQDKKTADLISQTAQSVYQSIASTTVSTEEAAESWKSNTMNKALLSKLVFRTGVSQFELCANFVTDQSHGATKKSSFTAADIAHHPIGYACFSYPVTARQAEKDDSIAENMLVVGTGVVSGSPDTWVQIYPLQPDTQGGHNSDVDLTGAQILQKDGTPGSATEVKLGDTVTIHYEINLLNAQSTVSKVVITDDTVYTNYCNIILLSGLYYPSPNPVCPASVNDLTVQDIGPTSLTAQTIDRDGVTIVWPLPATPNVFDASGKKINLSDLQVGDKVNLGFTGATLSGIKMVDAP